MNAKKDLFILFACAAALTAAADDIYTPTLRRIEQSSVTLQTLRGQADARKLACRADLAPDGPEVEFGYLWGNPVSSGPRKDVSARQSFDFPAAYARRGQLAGLREACAEYQYQAGRMELLLEAKRVCIELVYYNALSDLYAKRMERAERIAEAYETMLRSGDTDQLTCGKARLNRAQSGNDLRRIRMERDRLLAELARLGDGSPVAFEYTEYPTPTGLPANFERLAEEADSLHPALRLLQAEAEASAGQTRVTRAEALPSFSLGYMGEFTPGQEFQGVTVSMSVPVWETKGKTRAARAAEQASRQAADDARRQYRGQLESLYTQAMELQTEAEQGRAALNLGETMRLLDTAFDQGEMTLTVYLTELGYYYDAIEKQLRTERDLELTLAQFTATQL